MRHQARRDSPPQEQPEESTMMERRGQQDEINRVLQSTDQSRVSQEELHSSGEETEPLLTEPEPEKTETIHVYVVREGEEEEPLDEYVVESTLTLPEDGPLPSFDAGGARFFPTAGDRKRASLDLLAAYTSVFLLLLCIACEVLLALIAPTPTITLVPLARDLRTTATITAVPGTPAEGQIAGRQLPPLTLSQNRTAPATGKGHQDAEAARGTITFYNGLFSSQTVEAGTLLKGSDGVGVVTDQAAMIPAALATTPPTYGQVTVPAHALLTGPQGNIRVRDINEACCLTTVLAQNTGAFQGGQNERDFTVVARADIDNVSSSLTATLIKGEQAAFASQLSTGEALVTPACRPEVTPDHQPGAETTAVKVTVTERCRAVAYESASLRDEATRAFGHQAARLLGTHYSLVDAMRVQVVRSALRDNQGGIATISVYIGGTWAYRFSLDELKRIKESIAGHTLRQARQILLSLPGIRRIEIDGMGGNGRLPKDISHFHMLLLFGEIPLERDR
jgi:hypothetical protein